MIKEKFKGILKSKITIGVVCFFLGASIMSSGESTPVETPESKEKIETLSAKVEALEGENKELQAKVDEAKPWFEMKEEERKAEEERLAAEKAEKDAAEQAKKDEEARLEAERKAQEEQAKKEAEAVKYETGLTFEDLARNPTANAGKLVTFSGRIVQVMKGSGYTQYRMNIDDNYDKTVLIEIDNGLLTNGNILEDDYITIRGMFLMEQTYTTVLGAEQTIPAILVEEVDY